MSIEFFTPQILEVAKILNIHPIFLTDDPPSQILNFLYIGSMFNAAYLQGLKDLKVTHIVNVTKEIDNFYPDQFVYHRIRILDKDGQDLLPHLDNVVKFIKSAEQQGGIVIVHCKVGMCRSASIIAAYLKRYQKMTIDEAEKFMQEKRNIVRIRDSFKKQLNIFEQFINFFKLQFFYN